jgi:hypothetical protein
MFLKEIRCDKDISGSGLGLEAGSCEHGNELPGGIKELHTVSD